MNLKVGGLERVCKGEEDRERDIKRRLSGPGLSEAVVGEKVKGSGDYWRCVREKWESVWQPQLKAEAYCETLGLPLPICLFERMRVSPSQSVPVLESVSN